MGHAITLRRLTASLIVILPFATFLCDPCPGLAVSILGTAGDFAATPELSTLFPFWSSLAGFGAMWRRSRHTYPLAELFSRGVGDALGARGDFGPADKIREKLSEGLLPGKAPAHSWRGNGCRKPCNGCNEPILSTEVEYEVNFNGARIVRFHAACEAIWRSLIAHGANKAADSPIRA